MSDTRYIIGVGLRMGTTSLAAMLGACDGAHVTHEGIRHAMPYIRDAEALDRAWEALKARDGRYVGDVGYYWLNYVPDVLDRGARVILLDRPREDFVASARAALGTPDHVQLPETWVEWYDAHRLCTMATSVHPACHSISLADLTAARVMDAAGIDEEDRHDTTMHLNQR